MRLRLHRFLLLLVVVMFYCLYEELVSVIGILREYSHLWAVTDEPAQGSTVLILLSDYGNVLCTTIKLITIVPSTHPQTTTPLHGALRTYQRLIATVHSGLSAGAG